VATAKRAEDTGGKTAGATSWYSLENVETAAAAFQRLLKKSGKGKLSRRSTLMNADKAIVFNLRSSVFIGGQL
jgi:hypothetical protein